MKKKLKFLLPLLCMATLLFGSLTVSAAEKFATRTPDAQDSKFLTNFLDYCKDNNIVISGKKLVYTSDNTHSASNTALYVFDDFKADRMWQDGSFGYTSTKWYIINYDGGSIKHTVFENSTSTFAQNKAIFNFTYSSDGFPDIVANTSFFPAPPPVIVPVENLTGMVTANLKVITPVAVFCLGCMICLYLLARKLRIFL